MQFTNGWTGSAPLRRKIILIAEVLPHCGFQFHLTRRRVVRRRRQGWTGWRGRRGVGWATGPGRAVGPASLPPRARRPHSPAPSSGRWPSSVPFAYSPVNPPATLLGWTTAPMGTRQALQSAVAQATASAERSSALSSQDAQLPLDRRRPPGDGPHRPGRLLVRSRAGRKVGQTRGEARRVAFPLSLSGTLNQASSPLTPVPPLCPARRPRALGAASCPPEPREALPPAHVWGTRAPTVAAGPQAGGPVGASESHGEQRGRRNL